jgi:hypothetical protein
MSVITPLSCNPDHLVYIDYEKLEEITSSLYIKSLISVMDCPESLLVSKRLPSVMSVNGSGSL